MRAEKVIIFVCFVLTIVSVPASSLLASLLVRGQDAAGQGMYGSLLFFVFCFLASALFGGYATYTYRKHHDSLSKGFGALAFLSIAPCLVILLLVAILFVLEYGYVLFH